MNETHYYDNHFGGDGNDFGEEESRALVLPSANKDVEYLRTLTPEKQLDFFEMLDSYISVPSTLIDEYLNKKIKVLGCIIEEVPERIDEETGERLRAYRQVLLKLDETNKKGVNEVVRISTRKMLQKAEMWQALWGKGDWDKSVTMQVFLSGQQKLLQIVKE